MASAEGPAEIACSSAADQPTKGDLKRQQKQQARTICCALWHKGASACRFKGFLLHVSCRCRCRGTVAPGQHTLLGTHRMAANPRSAHWHSSSCKTWPSRWTQWMLPQMLAASTSGPSRCGGQLGHSVVVVARAPCLHRVGPWDASLCPAAPPPAEGGPAGGQRPQHQPAGAPGASAEALCDCRHRSGGPDRAGRPWREVEVCNPWVRWGRGSRTAPRHQMCAHCAAPRF